MKDRLLKIIKHYNLTSTRFADELGVERSGISHILSGRNQPSYDFIVKLMKHYPEISPDWLIMGNGPMTRAGIKEKVISPPDLFSSNQAVKSRHPPSEPSHPKEESQSPDVTYVTNIQQIVIFYPDGTFKPYLPVSNE